MGEKGRMDKRKRKENEEIKEERRIDKRKRKEEWINGRGRKNG
jgi:hypothetical protein